MLRQPTATLPVTPTSKTRRPAGRPRDESDASGSSETANRGDSLEEQLTGDDKSQQLSLAPVIRSKIQPPPVRSSMLSRQRLLDRLAESTKHRLTLLVAEAGYGKTTLLADFSARSSGRVLWFKLDITDADVVTWANYLVAAVREAEPDFGQSTLSLLSEMATGTPPRPVIVGTLMAELNALTSLPTTLVLDDFHLVDHSPEVNEIIGRLLRDAPSWLHLVISTRRLPELQLGRLAAMGELAELGTDDLRFSMSETEQLFADGYGQPLESDVLAEVDARTQGWAASLQLFYGSIRGRSSSAVRSLARSLSGSASPVYDFLAEEVLANIAPELEDFLLRSALLDLVAVDHAAALLDEPDSARAHSAAEECIEEADRLGLLTRTSQSSEIRQLHPLLRDFLLRQLELRYESGPIRDMHLRLANAISRSDPLTACRHYIEAGENDTAMQLLGKSVMLTMGSGQSGIAALLVDKLDGVSVDPAVAAIHARWLLDRGSLAAAAELLNGLEVTTAAPEVRAAVRYSKLSLGWRTGDRDLMFGTLREIQSDPATPEPFAEIFQIFIDSSPLASSPSTFTSLAIRMLDMAGRQSATKHTYFAAVSLHNAALTFVAAGKFREAEDAAIQALRAFDLLPGGDHERYSTHIVLALVALEMGRPAEGDAQISLALSSGAEAGDVHAEAAYAMATIGDRDRAQQLLARAADSRREGRLDVPGELTCMFASALLLAPTRPEQAIGMLEAVPPNMPLDTGYDLDRRILLATARLLERNDDEARSTALAAQVLASERGAMRSEVRLALLLALADANATSLRRALAAADQGGDLAILAAADAIGQSLRLIPDGPDELRRSISRWPARWLPILRRQLSSGATANALAAASLLDEYGKPGDVPLLRAFAKTYGRRLGASGVGRSLARRVTPTLYIHDLGRVALRISDREWSLGSRRRKAGTLLMYLITRPNHTASREQILEELWPDSDPASAVNNLNQALFYLRRDVDPWYEDDVSVEYFGLQSDVVWMDSDLVRVASVDFVAAAQGAMAAGPNTEVLSVLNSYGGQFSPEFEYEEWALAWRARVHSHYLQLGNWAVDSFSRTDDLVSACQAAATVLGTDASAQEIERKLIGLYFRLGHRSAARAQFTHLTAQMRSDGLPVPRFREVVGDT